MDKRVIFAVAGSGKTTFLIKQLNKTDNFLIVTYTNTNVENLRTGIIKKFGHFPSNIKLLSYFTFLYGFCYKPFLDYKIRAKGINYTPPPRYIRITDLGHFFDNSNRLYSSRISKYILYNGVYGEIADRVTKYYNYLFIDEIQDIGGTDFNFIKELSKASVSVLYVGDFNQHTFDTSRDGNINANLHDDIKSYQNEFKKMGLIIDTSTLSKSFRCSPTVCKFISDSLQIPIESHREDATIVEYIDDLSIVKTIYSNDSIVKLFIKEHYKFNCFSKNWGESKGEDNYNDVCIILNKKTLEKFLSKKLYELPQITKNKLYVALSRPKRNLYFVPYNLISIVNDK